MKRILSLAASVLLAATLNAKPIDQATALGVANRYLKNAVDVTPAGWDEVYLFTEAGGDGFVVVSADDCARPVLAYSVTQPFDAASMPVHVAAWIDGYRAEIASLRENGAGQSAEVAAMWNGAKDNSITSEVGPLMTTSWNQSPYYNSECPYSTSASRRAVAGCVATAMAQVMKYWNHPAVGHGSYTYVSSTFGVLSCTFDTAYQWSMMPDVLNRWSSDDQVHAVAQLIHHVGVSVGMKYGTGSSGAYVSANGGTTPVSAENALKTYFRYNPMLHSISKNRYTDTQWDSIMKVEIDHQRPVLYSGHDGSGGHAFVIDGYSSSHNPRNGNRYFHVNWGWGGSYDGYYTLDSLSPGAGGIGGNATYTFNSDNQALVNVMPSVSSLGDSLALVSVVSFDEEKGTVSGSGRYVAFNDTVTILAQARPGYRFSHWQSGATYNPVQFLANGDYIDTAVFVAIEGDTIGYSSDFLQSTWSDDYSDTTEWGIRIPAGMHRTDRALSAIQMYVYAGGYYDFNVYVGDAPTHGHLVYTKRDFIPSWQTWRTIGLDSAIYVSNHQPLWITVQYVGSGYAAAFSPYSGNEDGSWYKLQGRWQPYTVQGNYFTWMIKGIFEQRDERSFTISLATEGNDSAYIDLPSECYVVGDGVYHEDSLATIEAYSADAPLFWYWVSSQGDTILQNPYSFYPSSDITFTAVYGRDRSAVRSVEAVMPDVFVRDRMITIDAADGEHVQIFDAKGRLVSTAKTCVVDAAGVYIVHIIGSGTRKVVVL